MHTIKEAKARADFQSIGEGRLNIQIVLHMNVPKYFNRFNSKQIIRIRADLSLAPSKVSVASVWLARFLMETSQQQQ